jgi:hypothetical protein
MVRLVITDFPSKEDSEAFYIKDEFEESQNMFVYNSFKKNNVYLSVYNADEIYSLNILSKKHLPKNQFLIYIAEEEYVILFNHKTVYSAKINQNFLTDDIIKSILITKHITMLSSGGSIENIYYVINSKYKSAKENILKQNTRNERHEVVAKSLGELEELVKPLNELTTLKTHLSKLFSVLFTFSFSFWILFYGLELLTEKTLKQEPLSTLTRELKVQNNLLNKQKTLLAKTEKEYKKIIECIPNFKVKND